MDTNASREIRRAVDSGKVVFGQREAAYYLKQGKGELVVFAQNIPRIIKEELQHAAQLSNIPVYLADANALEIGNICGKPFVISTLLVLDQGKSKASELTNTKTMTEVPVVEKEVKERKPKRVRKKKTDRSEERRVWKKCRTRW